MADNPRDASPAPAPEPGSRRWHEAEIKTALYSLDAGCLRERLAELKTLAKSQTPLAAARRARADAAGFGAEAVGALVDGVTERPGSIPSPAELPKARELIGALEDAGADLALAFARLAVGQGRGPSDARALLQIAPRLREPRACAAIAALIGPAARPRDSTRHSIAALALIALAEDAPAESVLVLARALRPPPGSKPWPGASAVAELAFARCAPLRAAAEALALSDAIAPPEPREPAAGPAAARAPRI